MNLKLLKLASDELGNPWENRAPCGGTLFVPELIPERIACQPVHGRGWDSSRFDCVPTDIDAFLGVTLGRARK